MAILGNVTGTLIGKVVYANVQQSTTKNGKDYEEFSVGIQLPNGSTVFVRNRVFEASRQVSALKPRIALLESVVEDYKSEDIYLRLRLRPDEKTNENKYAKFTTYINKEDRISFSGEGYLDKIEHVVEEDVVYLVFTNQKQEEYKVKFEDYNTNLTIIGYVKEIDDTLVTVVDSAEDYPAMWHINATNEVADKLKIGHMYGFVVKFVKGEANSSKKSNEDLFSFTEEFTVKQTTYASDRLDLVSGGIVKTEPITFNGLSSYKSKASAVNNDEEFPF